MSMAADPSMLSELFPRPAVINRDRLARPQGTIYTHVKVATGRNIFLDNCWLSLKYPAGYT